MPNRQVLVLIVILSVFAVLLGWNYWMKPFGQMPPSTEVATTPSEITSPTPQPLVLSPSAAVAEVLAFPLSLDSVALENATPPAATMAANVGELEDGAATFSTSLDWIATFKPGLVTLFGSRVSSQSAQIAIQKIRAQYPDPNQKVLIAVDHEGGTVQRLSGAGFTRLPSWRSLCAQSASQSAQLLEQSAQELQKAGIDIVLAPVTDLDAGNSPLGSRTCSDDPEVVTANTTQFMTIFQKHHILTTLKHFPGIGGLTKDLHRSFDRITVTPESAEVYRQLLETFPETLVLTSHVGVINQYQDIPCSLSSFCIDEISNNYPHALILSDALDMTAAQFVAQPSPNPTATTSGRPAAYSRTLPQVAIAAIRAGNEVLIFGDQVSVSEMDEVYQTLLREYQEKPEFKTQIDQAAAKILARKAESVTNLSQ